MVEADGLASRSVAGELAHGKGSSLSVDHDAEALEIVETGAFLGLLHLESGRASSELLGELELLGGLGDSGGSGTTEETGDDELGHGESAHGVEAAGEAFTINENLFGVDPVDNDDELAVILTKVNKSGSASLHKVSKDLKTRGKPNLSFREQACLTAFPTCGAANPLRSCELVKVYIPFLLLYYYIK